MAPLRIFMVNLDFPPIGGPGVWRILAMAKYAALAGHKVTVFCSDRASWHGRMDESLLKRIPAGVEVIRVHAWFLTDTLAWLERLAQSVRSNLLRRLILAFRWRLDYYWPDSVLYWAVKMALVAAWHARRDRPDGVFTTGPQHLSHLTGYLLRKWSGSVWVMDYRDPWTHPAEIAASSERVPYQHRLFSWVEGKLISQASVVTVVTPTWMKEIRNKYCLPEDTGKFHLIRNGHDLLPSDCQQPSALSESSGYPIKVHFNGTIQSNNNLLSSLVSALSYLGQEGINPRRVQLSFCGLPEDFKGSLQGSPYVACFVDRGAMDHARSLACCRESDALLVMVRSGNSMIFRGAVPGKTYEAIALGKHIFGVLPAQCDTRNLLEEYPNVTLTKDTEVAAIVDGLRQLMRRFEDSGQRLPLTPIDVRRKLAAKYSRHSQADQLIDIIQSELAIQPR